MSTGEVFSCPVGGWLDNGSGSVGPGSRTVNCTSSGDCMKNIAKFADAVPVTLYSRVTM